MAYSWKGMRKLSWNEVKQLHKKGELAGCFRLYADETEGMIEPGYDFIDDVLEHYEQGGEFGEEIDTLDLELTDGKKIVAPEVIDISELGCLDELEYELWNTIESYMTYFGIRTENDEPDWATVKAVQECLLEQFIAAGINFKLLSDEKSEEIEKEIKKKESKSWAARKMEK